jgi:hypothetical protein
MTLGSSVSNHDDVSSTAFDADVYRQLIQQFYERSIQRYGIDSDQSRMLELHLTAHTAQD